MGGRLPFYNIRAFCSVLILSIALRGLSWVAVAQLSVGNLRAAIIMIFCLEISQNAFGFLVADDMNCQSARLYIARIRSSVHLLARYLTCLHRSTEIAQCKKWQNLPRPHQ